MSIYKCKECGNQRWFYNEITIGAKRLIDLKEGKDNDKVYDVDKTYIDCEFEMIFCKKCGNKVSDESLH